MSYGLETFYSDGGVQISQDYLYLRAFQKGFITTTSTLPGTLLTLPAGYESPLPVFRGNYANACFESQNQLRLFAPYGTDYKLLAPVPFPERSGYGIQARNASNQIYFDNEGDYFSVDAVFNLRRTVVYDGIDRVWFNIPLAAPPNGRLRYASLNFFEAGRGYASGAPQAQVAPLLINVTNTNINLKYAFNSMAGFAAPGWSGTSDWDGFDADIYIVTGY